ncbi:MAG: hypothetical protein ACJ8CB_36030 [Ktedonobacteraceae bacterium]
MWLTTPDRIEHILVERQLEPVSEKALERSARDWQRRGVKLAPYEVVRNMPVVQIGQPYTQTLQEFCAPAELPHPFQAMLREADFYVVSFSCSFRPIGGQREQSRVEWARFCATLLPHPSTGTPPIAFDVYPQQVIEEVKRQTKVTINPLLKFQELEVSPGSAEFGIEYNEQIPRISGTRGTGFNPSWDYWEVPGHKVYGDRWMRLLVKAPKGMTNAQARLDLGADVLVGGTRLRVTAWRRQEQADQCTVSLWG